MPKKHDYKLSQVCLILFQLVLCCLRNDSWCTCDLVGLAARARCGCLPLLTSDEAACHP